MKRLSRQTAKSEVHCSRFVPPPLFALQEQLIIEAGSSTDPPIGFHLKLGSGFSPLASYDDSTRYRLTVTLSCNLIFLAVDIAKVSILLRCQS